MESSATSIPSLREPLQQLALSGSGVPLVQRLAATQELLEALQEGHEPDWSRITWPNRAYLRVGWEALLLLQLPRFTVASEEIAVAATVALIEDAIAAERAESEHIRLSQHALNALTPDEQSAGKLNLTIRARNEAAEVLRQRQLGRWATLVVEVWKPVAELFDQLGVELARGWDLSAGIISRQGLERAKELQRLLARAPQLREIIAHLGRVRESSTGRESKFVEVFREVTDRVVQMQRVWTDRIPTETRSIHRSADIARMLPSESILLTRPTTKLLWYARLVERNLNTYLLEGQELIESGFLDKKRQVAELEKRPLDRGPIILCLDTSGSMQGMPETVAKALTLACATAAHRQDRRCYLYAFGSTNQVIEHELKLTTAGIPSLLAFLEQSFGGGTDPAGPLLSAIGRTRSEKWSSADIMVVTDGIFHLPEAVLPVLAAARKEQDLELVGVLVGKHPSIAMEGLCDRVHTVHDWSALSGDVASN